MPLPTHSQYRSPIKGASGTAVRRSDRRTTRPGHPRETFKNMSPVQCGRITCGKQAIPARQNRNTVKAAGESARSQRLSHPFNSRRDSSEIGGKPAAILLTPDGTAMPQFSPRAIRPRSYALPSMGRIRGGQTEGGCSNSTTWPHCLLIRVNTGPPTQKRDTQ